LARLPFESCLLSFDPAQLADYSQTYRFIADPEWRGNANTAGWRVYAEVKVFYVFPYDLDRDARDRDGVSLSTHFDS
jgi:hypothetical protein